MYLLLDVEGRSGIRIHKGSYAGASDHGYKTDFLGCISFGRGVAWDKNWKQHLLHSTAVTIRNLEEKFEGRDFTLNVTGDTPLQP